MSWYENGHDVTGGRIQTEAPNLRPFRSCFYLVLVFPAKVVRCERFVRRKGYRQERVEQHIGAGFVFAMIVSTDEISCWAHDTSPGRFSYCVSGASVAASNSGSYEQRLSEYGERDCAYMYIEDEACSWSLEISGQASNPKRPLRTIGIFLDGQAEPY
jgi:hypothetical protein